VSGGAVDGPLDHLLRVLPPWHTGPALTECGRPLGDVKSVVSREVLAAKVAREGQRRAAFSTCMTCAQLVGRTSSWAVRPAVVVDRWARGAWSWSHGSGEVGERQRRELLAVGMLLEEHRAEFEDLVAGLGEAADLGQARRLARRKGRP
jgi:hypothetical protein